MLNVAVLFFARSGYFFLPVGHGVSPSGGVWDACAACDFASPARDLRFSALWAQDSAARLSFERLPGTGQRGPVRGCAPPWPPLHSPRNTPQETFQFPSGHEGNASPAAGASLTRSARSGDLPPRRVNAIPRSRFVQSPLQPNTTDLAVRLGSCFALFFRDFWAFSHHQARLITKANKNLHHLDKVSAIMASSVQI